MVERTVGILLFNEVEVLDFAGPFEVFSLATLPDCDRKAFKVKTVSQDGKMISARNGLKVTPDYHFDNHPVFDILIVPGGYGAEEVEIYNTEVIQWITKQLSNVEFITSV